MTVLLSVFFFYFDGHRLSYLGKGVLPHIVCDDKITLLVKSVAQHSPGVCAGSLQIPSYPLGG